MTQIDPSMHVAHDKPVYDQRWSKSRGTKDSRILCFRWPKTQVEFFYLQYNRLIRRSIESYAPKRRPLRLLEVGCGRGTAALFQTVELGVEAYLTDFSFDALKIARDNFSEFEAPCRIVQGDAYQLPLPDRSMDVVISLGVLEHFPDPAQPMAEMCRVLVPDGLMISMNVPERPDNIQRVAVRLNRHLSAIQRASGWGEAKPWLDATRSKTGDVFRTYDGAAHFAEATRRAGFHIERIEQVNPFPTIDPLPRAIEWLVVRGYEAFMALRSRFQPRNNPYGASERNARCHFVIARKPPT